MLCYVTELRAQETFPDEKRIVFYVEEIPLKDALVTLSKRSGVNIAYRSDIIPDEALVSVNAKSQPLGKVLDIMLEGTDLAYTIVGTQIVIESASKKIVKTEQIQQKEELTEVLEFVTISGTIVDKASGETLPYANIYTANGHYGTSANAYGFYSLSIPKGQNTLNYSYIGYEFSEIKEDFQKNTIANIEATSTSQLNEVLIVDNPINEEVDIHKSIDVPVKLLSSMVPLGGESDVIKYLQSTPGITTGADGVGGISVRGGSVEHNLFLLDGVPIYEINHALGLFSVFNNYAIKSSSLYKSSFPARYSGRLASVVDIRTKEGNVNKFGGEIGIGSITGKITIEGPIEKGKSSFIFSARRTLLDPFITSVSNFINTQAESTGNRDYRFYDIFGKMNFKVNQNNQIFFTVFNANDTYASSIETPGEVDDNYVESIRDFNFSSTNTLVGLKWNHKASNTTFLRTNLYYTSYGLDVFELLTLATFSDPTIDADIVTYDGALFDSQIRDIGLQIDCDKIYHSGNSISYGFSSISHSYSPGVIIADEESGITPINQIPQRSDLSTQLSNDRLRGFEHRVYGDYKKKYGNNRNILSLGLNLSIHAVGNQKSYFIPEPRLSLLHMLGNVQFRLSYARLSQFNHRISTTSLGWPLDIWVPSTSLLRPQTTSIYNISFTSPVSRSVKIYAEGYFKTLRHLTSFNAGGIIDISDGSNWELKIPQGDGRAYGIELGLDKHVGKLIASLNYVWSYTDRQFDLINNGNRFPYRYDRRHSFKTTLVYRVSDQVEVSANWIYATGNPTSVPALVTIEEGNYKFLFDKINGERLDPFHRLDFGFNFYSDLDWAKLKFTIGAYNVYNRKNPYYLDVIPDDNVNVRQFSILPIVPSISVNLQF